MKIIGLTGGIASGKSTVTKILRDEGQVVIDADELAREVVAPGTFGLKSVTETFGPGLLTGGASANWQVNSLNRKALREKIFSDENSRLILERITHPLIQWRARGEFEFYRRQKQGVVFYDAALIYEKDLVRLFNGVIVVHTTPEVQLKRLMSRDRILEEDAHKRLAAQWPLEKKIPLADFTIDNNASQDETRKQVKELVKKLVK
jgi:dephospho-CoA kinase